MTTPPPFSIHSVCKLALLGTYVPRVCGIATFTSDLAKSLKANDDSLIVDVVAMDDGLTYNYPDEVICSLAEQDLDSYRTVAQFLNNGDYDALSIQHEFGIYGGDAGKHILALVRELKIPLVTTLHTVLSKPSPAQRAVLDELMLRSARVVVMSKQAVKFLREIYNVPADKIDLIPHGIPHFTPDTGKALRTSLHLTGPMLGTFGLLSPGKGIEFVIEAMPAIIAQHPGATFYCIGASHPHTLLHDGSDPYRDSLTKLCHDLGVQSSVKFVDRYVSYNELVDYLGALDIYVTPSLNPQQITSGTLAYAVGAGKAVIATPYSHAKELLADGRGFLVPFRDSVAISDVVLDCLRNPEMTFEMSQKGATYGKTMVWDRVGALYLNSFSQARAAIQSDLPLLVASAQIQPYQKAEIPSLNLHHLFELSDDTGILQHAKYAIANRDEGYCVDDNARALILTCKLERLGALSDWARLMQSRYMSFLMNAFNSHNGRFRNFMSYDRQWLEQRGSDDSHGRSLWALGTVVSHATSLGLQEAAVELMRHALPTMEEINSPRAWAYAILGCEEYLASRPHEEFVRAMRDTLVGRLMTSYVVCSTQDWHWYENSATYGNARLPQALIIAGRNTGNEEVLSVGLKSLAWLMKKQTGPEGVFAPVGSNGWLHRGEPLSRFDQQPIEACGAVSACHSAALITGDPIWHAEARRAFNWFLGENMLGLPLYDEFTGGCYDGLHKDRVNLNQGAESTLSFLTSLLEFHTETTTIPALTGQAFKL
ncbi:MAG: glycosyltransferase family 4 protein [Armatimonadetes bacterium]|nr:glycosyltransferase family 4 protein [Armatimonadota bacterium]